MNNLYCPNYSYEESSVIYDKSFPNKNSNNPIGLFFKLTETSPLFNTTALFSTTRCKNVFILIKGT